MFNFTSIKKITFFTLFFFSTFVMMSNLSYAQNEDVFGKVNTCVQEGAYDKAEGILAGYIEGIRSIEGQEQNLAKAYYLMAKIYYLVDEPDDKVDENLRLVFKTYPAFTQQEADSFFKERVEKIRKEFPVTQEVIEPQPIGVQDVKPVVDDNDKSGVIERPQIKKKKKKKKFPFLLVFGGIAVLAAVIILLTKKKKEEPKAGTIASVTVKFTIKFRGENMQTRHKVYVDGNEKLNQLFNFTKHYNENHGYDDLQHITKTLTFKKNLGQFTVMQETGPSWSKYYPNEGTFIGGTDYELEVLRYDYENGYDPGRPRLSDYSFDLNASPWENDPTDEWYRIKTKTITISPASSSASRASIRRTQDKPKSISDKGDNVRK